MSGMPLRGDRIHRYVNAFCPVCHEERPDRPLAEVQRLSGLAGRARRPDLARARLRDARPGPHAVRRVARDPDVPRAVDGADQAPRARRPRQLQARARGVRRRPARDADPAHVHPARGPPRPLQPEVPDVLRRVVARAGVGRAVGAGAGLHRRPALAGEPAHRRADAVRRRADALPLAGRAARRRRRAADRARAGQHQRPAPRPGRRAARPPHAAPRAGRGLPAVRRRVGRGVGLPPRSRHPPLQGARHRATLGQRDLHDAHHDRGPRRERRRDRPGHQARARHAVRRWRDDPARLRQRPVAARSTRSTGSPTPACSRGWTSRPPAR